MKNQEKKYIGTYKVLKIYEKSGKKLIIEKGLTEEEAKRIVNSFPNSNVSMVVYAKQFYADKYFV